MLRVVLAALVPLVIVVPAAGSGGRAASVAVTFEKSRLTVTPSRIAVGRVVFRIVNREQVPRTFRLDGGRGSTIAPGRSVRLTVDLVRRGLHEYLSPGRGRTPRLTGVLTAFEPCIHPTTTTVHVQMDHARTGITFSQPRLSCGTVTFAVTNVGAMVDSLQIFADFPNAAAATPRLSPGQTAKLTVRLGEKGTAYYASGEYPPGEPEFGGEDSDGGSIPIG